MLSVLPLFAHSVIYKNQKLDLDKNAIGKALNTYALLNKMEHFNTQRLKKDPILWQEAFDAENAQPIQISAADGHLINALFADRHADTVILLGQGFHARKEYLVPFLKLFAKYDLLFFDYQGHREMVRTYIRKGRSTLDTYFIEPQQDARSLVTFLRARKNYKNVIGLGMCYSGLIFSGAQAQASSEGEGQLLFDKLILDSAILSMQDVTLQVFQDPLLCCNNKTGGAPWFLQKVLSLGPVRCFAKALGYLFLGRQFSDIRTDYYIRQVNVPILFLCANDDKFVPHNSLMQMYDATQKESSCVITFPAPHTLNHIKCKELYAHLVKEFIEANSVSWFI